MPTAIAVALALADMGLHVFPIVPGKKTPATPHGFKDATTNELTISEWWQLKPDFGLAIATGKTSDLFVVDIDKEKDGEASLAALVAEYGDLPETIEVTTGSGRHLYYRLNGHDIPSSVEKLAKGIDIRSTGGYVVCPPSIHPNRKPYRWSGSSALADPPEWLINRLYCTDSLDKARNPNKWSEIVKTIPEGRRDDSLARIAGHMLSRYVDPDIAEAAVVGINETRCEPPLPEDDVRRIVDSIMKAECRKRGLAT